MIEEHLYARAAKLAGTDDGTLLYRAACEIDKLRQELDTANRQYAFAEFKAEELRELASANGFASITEAITFARKARDG